jgi:hypothetical protein
VGDKLTHAHVRVLPPIIQKDGKLVVEPGSIILAPGQAERMTVNIETADGEKIDRTGSAIYKVADPSIASIDDGIGRVKALKEGKTTIMVNIAGMPSLSVPLEVTGEEIKEISAEPASLQLPVGGVSPLMVFGRADKSGLKEMFAQPDLKGTPRKTGTVEVNGDMVTGKAEGDDTIDVSWRNKLKVEVPVKVVANAITGLDISPKDKTINTSQGVTYEVTGMRGSNRVVLGANDGVQLNVTDSNVADVAAGTTVISKAPGETKVVATLGGEKAETNLTVTQAPPGELPPGQTDVISGGVVYGPGGSVIHVGDGVGDVKPVGKVVGLKWEPDLFIKGVQAAPQVAKLLRQYENGGFDDVSNDPGVNVPTDHPNPAIAKMEKVDGGWKITPVAPGLTTVTATLGDQTAKMNIEINGDEGGKPLTGTLIVNPSLVTLWLGESMTPSAEIDPGNGQAHIPVKVKITAPENQGIVKAEGDKITGEAVGDVTVTVTPENGGPSATLNVHVTAADTITIEPGDFMLQPGQAATAAVMAQPAGGGEKVAVQVPIESLDKNVIDADPSSPGQFTAKSQGQTQLRAVYRGKEVFAKVSVAGQRFQSVRSSYNDSDKSVTIDVSAAASEGEIEYRVYEDGVPPKENWVPNNQQEGDARKATLRSDPITDKPEVHLTIEARDKATKSVQKYPLTLVEKKTYTQQDSSSPTQPPRPQ